MMGLAPAAGGAGKGERSHERRPCGGRRRGCRLSGESGESRRNNKSGRRARLEAEFVRTGSRRAQAFAVLLTWGSDTPVATDQNGMVRPVKTACLIRDASPDPSPEVLRGWISCCGRLEGKAGARCDFGEDRKRRFRPCTDSFLSRSGRQPGVQGTLKHRPGGNPSEAEGEEACGRYAGAACSGCSTAAARLRTTRMKSLCHG